ncbi:MAG: zinc-dependent alcohol dehydrogenase family protein [Candidatus Ornithomonoglobus sp.]
MKSAVFYGKEDLRIEELEIPEVKSDEVLIKVHACGICGTDMHIFDGDEGAAATPTGTVLGHEFAGEIVKVGAAVTDFKTGDRVCVDPNKLCNKCYFCKSGMGHFCTDMIGIGTTVNGGFSEYCAVPDSQVYKFSDGTSYAKAAMTEPVACCLHGIDMCSIKHSDTVAIIGAGMIGLIMLQLARLGGARRVIVLEPIEEKRKIAEKLGADLTIDSINDDVNSVLAENGIKQIDVVIECVGRINTLEMGIEIAGKNSTLMMFGLTKPDAVLPIRPFEIFKKEIVLKASYINPYTQERALGLIDSGKIDVESMIYKEISLDELPEILADKSERAKGKYIVNPQM